MKILKEVTQRRRVFIYDMDKSQGRLLLISQKGRGSPSIGPASIHFCYSGLTPPHPALFDCYGCLMKICRRHYHINRATKTRRTGNLSSSSSVEARSIKKIAWAKTGIGLPTPVGWLHRWPHLPVVVLLFLFCFFVWTLYIDCTV